MLSSLAVANGIEGDIGGGGGDDGDDAVFDINHPSARRGRRARPLLHCPTRCIQHTYMPNVQSNPTPRWNAACRSAVRTPRSWVYSGSHSLTGERVEIDLVQMIGVGDLLKSVNDISSVFEVTLISQPNFQNRSSCKQMREHEGVEGRTNAHLVSWRQMSDMSHSGFSALLQNGVPSDDVGI